MNLEKYFVENLELLDSPSLLVFTKIVDDNINEMIRVSGDVKRLMPHIKTNKMEKVVQKMLEKSISRFKCATIAEAELAAQAGAREVLISHQLVGPKITRLIKLIKAYPETQFASLVDCNQVSVEINEVFENVGLKANVFYDINSGMDRSGHEVNNDLIEDVKFSQSLPNLNFLGFHVYDGHQRNDSLEQRKIEIERDLNPFYDIYKAHFPTLEIIAGGSPAFNVHTLVTSRTLSPGTSVFWDWGYGDRFPEQKFKYATLILTRIISKPKAGIITLDMGHKAVASENPIDKRVRFLNNPDLELISQSEEHGVVTTENWEKYKVGDCILAVPYHICPTVNLYDEAYAISEGKLAEIWEIKGRKRKITI